MRFRVEEDTCRARRRTKKGTRRLCPSLRELWERVCFAAGQNTKWDLKCIRS